MAIVERTRAAEAQPNVAAEPDSGSPGPGSVVAVVMDFVGATLPHFDQLLECMRLRPSGPGLTGSLFQWSRRTADGVRVTEVWQSRDHFDFFFREEIEPLLSGTGLREPEITIYDVHSYLAQGPDAAPGSEDEVFGSVRPRAHVDSGREVPAPTEGP